MNNIFSKNGITFIPLRSKTRITIAIPAKIGNPILSSLKYQKIVVIKLNKAKYIVDLKKTFFSIFIHLR
jgi:hypothetical protein